MRPRTLHCDSPYGDAMTVLRPHVILGALLAVLLFPAAATPAPSPTPEPLTFGIYPGGGVGAVNAVDEARPDDDELRLAALERLRGDRKLVLHLYVDWTGARPLDDELAWSDHEIDMYASRGFDLELVVRYRPAAHSPRRAPRRYAQAVRQIVRRYADQPRLVSLQVTNEGNVAGAPAAADGAYAGVAGALVKGVVAAKSEARRLRLPLRVGFNWAAAADARTTAKFWRSLACTRSRAFRRSVDWVGVDVYPGTWSEPAPADVTEPGAVERVVTAALAQTRAHMERARLPRRARLHVAEVGFPTGPGRSDAAQRHVVEAAVAAVHRGRARYGVSDLRWFDLRDADSASPHMESHYGLVRDDYSEKPAFAELAGLIARWGAGER